MKKLLAIIVLSLCLITPSQANDIRDFQIEGISIGDSLLDYFSENEIKNNLNTTKFYEPFGTAVFSSIRSAKLKSKLKTYNYMQIVVMRDDKNYIIIAMDAANLKDNFDMNNCKKEAKKIANEFKKLFGKSTTYHYKKMAKHGADNTGKSINDSHFFMFGDNSFANVGCTDWSKELRILDRLYISLVSKKMKEIIDQANQQ